MKKSELKEMIRECIRQELKEAKTVTSKAFDDLYSVNFGGQQMFVGTKKECDDWTKKHPDPKGANSGRMTIKKGANVPVIEATNAVSKTTNKLCSVVFDGDTQIFTGTRKDCEDWLNTKGVMHRDRLSIKDSAKVAVKESLGKTADEIIRRYDANVADHILELEHEMAFSDAEWFEDGWYTLEDVKVHPDYYILVMDRPIESLADTEAIINYAFNNMTINIYDAMSEGGIVQDDSSNEIYVECWVVE